MTQPDPNRLLASFGRTRGRRLRAGKQRLMDELLPKIELSLDEVSQWQGATDTTLFPHSATVSQYNLCLEIGFGGGEHLAHQAALHPDRGFIGCEPFINGIGDLLKKIEAQALSNIRIFPDDARLLLEKLPDASLSHVFILYPDPWPKARHHKRRLVAKPLLDMLARTLRAGGQLQLATDHEGYACWMLEQLLSHPAFRWHARRAADWLNPPPDWLSTRYEQKALAGRPTYLLFERLASGAPIA